MDLETVLPSVYMFAPPPDYMDDAVSPWTRRSQNRPIERAFKLGFFHGCQPIPWRIDLSSGDHHRSEGPRPIVGIQLSAAGDPEGSKSPSFLPDQMIGSLGPTQSSHRSLGRPPVLGKCPAGRSSALRWPAVAPMISWW